jgi:hypothetical protein
MRLQDTDRNDIFTLSTPYIAYSQKILWQNYECIEINGFLIAAVIKIPTANFSQVWHIGQALNAIFQEAEHPYGQWMITLQKVEKNKCEISGRF